MASAGQPQFFFANEGAKLVLADWNEDGLAETLGLVLNSDAEAITKKTNVSVENEIRQLIELALQTHSVVDIVCNNAGITGQLTSLEEQDAEDWQQVYGVNVSGRGLHHETYCQTYAGTENRGYS